MTIVPVIVSSILFIVLMELLIFELQWCADEIIIKMMEWTVTMVKMRNVNVARIFGIIRYCPKFTSKGIKSIRSMEILASQNCV